MKRRGSEGATEQIRRFSVSPVPHFAVWLVLIVTVTLAAIAAAVFLSYRDHRETLRLATTQFNQQQLILARSAATGIETFIAGMNDDLLALSVFPVVQRMEPGILDRMKALYMGTPPGTSSRRLDKNGILRFIYPNEGWRKELVGRNYSNEAFFQQAKETGDVVVSGVITNEVGERRVRVARPVYIEDEEGEFNGVVICSFDSETLASLYVSPIVSGETGYAWLLNEDGIFLAHQHEGFVGKNAFEARTKRNPDISYEAINQIHQRMIAGEEGVGDYVSGWHREQTGEIKKLIAYTPVHVGNKIWSVAVCAPVSEVNGILFTARRSEWITLGFVILVLVIGGFALFITSHRWSHSLEWEVTRQTEELREILTERVQTEDALRESEERFRAIFETAQDSIFIKDRTLKYTQVNPAMERLFGLPASKLIGLTDEDLFSEEAASHIRKVDSRVLGGEIIEEEDTKPVKGIPYTFHVIKVPMCDSSGEIIGLCGIARDITERKRAERRLELSFTQLAETIARAMESQDPYTAGHQRQVAELARTVGEKLGLEPDRLQGLYIAGLLHDIGKISIPSEILTHPGKLSDAERTLICTHPRRGYEILEQAEFPWPVADIALHHHERLDGTGYPDGLKGDQLSLEVRILGVCDVVDAMSSNRPYRPARPKEMVVEELLSGRGTRYDEKVVDIMLGMLEDGETMG